MVLGEMEVVGDPVMVTRPLTALPPCRHIEYSAREFGAAAGPPSSVDNASFIKFKFG